MITLLLLFGLLCVGTVALERVKVIHALGFKLNLILLISSIAILFLWWCMRIYVPLTTIPAQSRMVLISLVGFLEMVLSITAAVRNLAGVKLGFVLGLSVLIALIHLYDMIVSTPVS